MTNQTTIDKLHDMRLGTMADAFESQLQDADTFTGLSFEDRFGMLVDTEWAKRRSTKLQKRYVQQILDTPMHAWKILSIFKTKAGQVSNA